MGFRPISFYLSSSTKVKIYFNKKIAIDLTIKNIEVETIVKTKSTVSSYLAGTDELVQEEFDKSLSIFHGLENLKDKHNLDAFAIRCWPETFTEYGCASCGPMAMMNEKKVRCA